MSKSERLRRRDPERTGPIRNMTGYLRESHSWGETPPDGTEQEPPPRAASSALDDVVAHGVRVGYQIIEEQIRQGRQTAQRLRQTGEGTEKRGGDMDALVERAIGVSKDLGALCMDTVDFVVKSAAVRRVFAGREAPRSAEPTDSHPVRETRLSIEVGSSRPVQVTASLAGVTSGSVPLAHALYAIDPSLPPLMGISFEPGLDPAVPVLKVRIPDGIASGTYTGVVVDGGTNQPVGTLSIRIQD